MADYSKILKKGLYSNYKALETKDANVLYFCTDTKQIFLGENLLSAGAEVVATRPTSPSLNTAYFCKDTGNVDVYDGSAWTTIVKGATTVVNASSTDAKIPTAKAVWTAINNSTSGTNAEVVAARGSFTKLGDRLDDYGSKLDDLLYKAIAINSFTNNVNTVEMGSTVASVTLNWSLNKTPKTLTLDNAALAVGDRTKAFTGQAITANKTYTLKATDDRNASATKSTSITFLNGVYWGVGDNKTSFDSAFILALSKGLQSSKAKTFTVNAAAGKHIYYAVPSRYGTCSFNVGGFDGGFGKVATISFTNASGYTENYDIYKSDNAGLGNTTVKVS